MFSSSRYLHVSVAISVLALLGLMGMACTHVQNGAGTHSTRPGSAMVAGSGKGRYYVHDVSGKILVGEQTNAAVELLPGNYIVELNGTTQSITVSEGQNATVAAGGATVAGSGTGRYYVHDVAGKILIGGQTNAAVELLPGNYTVELNGTTQR